MICRKCKGDTKVYDSRTHEQDPGITRRRRECLACGFRFVTYESPFNPLRMREASRRSARAWRARLTPEEKAAKHKRDALVEAAKSEAKSTGRPVAEIRREWGIAPRPNL